jgi:hypothetical protein
MAGDLNRRNGDQRTHSDILRVYVAEAVSAGDILAVTGVTSGYQRVVKADANGVASLRSARLLVAKHAIAAAGVFQAACEWRIIDGDFSASAAGDPLYLSDTAGAYSTSPGSNAYVVGRVLTAATAGKALLAPGMVGAESRVWSVSKTVTHADLTAAATSESISFGRDIPAGSMVLAAYFALTTEFSGGAVSACVVDLGDAGDDDRWIDAENIFTSSGTGVRRLFANDPPGLKGKGIDFLQSAASPLIKVTTTGANVSVLDAGSITVTLVVLNVIA